MYPQGKPSFCPMAIDLCENRWSWFESSFSPKELGRQVGRDGGERMVFVGRSIASIPRMASIQLDYTQRMNSYAVTMSSTVSYFFVEHTTMLSLGETYLIGALSSTK